MVFLHPAGEQRQPLHGHPDLRIELGRDGIPVRAAERGVYTAGHGEVGVHALAPQPLDDLLAEAAQADRFEGELRVGGDDAEDVADGRVGIEAQDEVRAGQVEEVHPVGLHHLRHVQKLPQQHRRPRQFHPDDGVAGLGGGQVMADRADPADALGDLGHLEVGAAFAELFQAAELVHVQEGRLDLAPVVEVDRDAGVALDAGDGFNGYFLFGHVVTSSVGDGVRS